MANEEGGAMETTTQYPVRLQIDYPEQLSRLSTFFRGLLGIPHLIVLIFVGIAQGVVMFISWWIVLFTGKYPKGLFDFVVNTMRWQTRVNAYSAFLTDRYPPFNGRP